ncbi:MAG TPA: hypothetical protein V6D50_25535 [Chroococcales cyanobacterium]|jgi:hypothetical protein
MSSHSKKTIKKIVLLSLSTVIITSSAVLCFLILGNAFSQVLTNVLIYYNAMMKQQLTIP